MEILRVLAEIWGGIATVVVALWIIPGSPVRKAIDTWIEKRVSHRFALELEDHRHQLAIETERLKARYQGDLHNLGIVAERRHEVCRELFRRVYESSGKVTGLFGMREMPDFEQFAASEVIDYMCENGFTEWQIESISRLWDDDRRAAVQELHAINRVKEIGVATRAYADAWNYFLSNSLYLSDEVTDLGRKIFDTLWQILGAAKLPKGTYKGTEITELQQRSSDLNWQLRTELQRALGVAEDDVGVAAERLMSKLRPST